METKPLVPSCFVPASSVTPATITWMWRDRVALGQISLLEGETATNKSTLAVRLASAVSTGDSTLIELEAPGRVLYLSQEDDSDTTLHPRLEAAGANLDHVQLDSSKSLIEFPADIGKLEEWADSDSETPARLVVLDPLEAYIQTKLTDSKGLRRTLHAIQRFAKSRGIAVVGIRHFRKSGGPAKHRGLGSISGTAFVRSVLAVYADPSAPGRRIVDVTKGNDSAPVPPIAFDVAVVDGRPVAMIDTTSVGVVSVPCATAHSPKLEAARAFIIEKLREGPMPADDVLKVAEAAGIAEKTLRRAADEDGLVIKEKGGMDEGWSWRLAIAPITAA